MKYGEYLKTFYSFISNLIGYDIFLTQHEENTRTLYCGFLTW
jgi:hypothetical protein